MTTELQGLNCKACSAPLPPPIGTTVRCQYCEASYLVSRPNLGSAGGVASLENPASLRIPLQAHAAILHEWLLLAATQTDDLDLDFLRSLSSTRLSSETAVVWAMTVQIQGGFTCMIGVNEIRQRLTTWGIQPTIENYAHMAWSPFSSQVRLSRTLVGGAGDEISASVASLFRSLGEVPELLTLAEVCDLGARPQLSAMDAWNGEVSQWAKWELEAVSRSLLQGDAARDMKYNVEVYWQPALLGIEYATLVVGEYRYGLTVMSGGIHSLGPLTFPRGSARAQAQQLEHSRLKATSDFRATLKTVGRVSAIVCCFGLFMTGPGVILVIALASAASWLILSRKAASLGLSQDPKKWLSLTDAAWSEINALRARLIETQRQEVAAAFTRMRQLY